ncbi:MAG: C25 family cysteine peptidase [Pseudomonadota bacterium]
MFRVGPTCVVSVLLALLGAGHIRAALALDPQNTANTCDYIIIADDNLSTQAQALDTLRNSTMRSCLFLQSQLSVFGQPTLKENIRAFILSAYQSWKIAPTYVMLFGDANIVTPALDRIPTQMSAMAHSGYAWRGTSNFANDTYYAGPLAVPVGQKKPIVHLGRIPARTTTQASNAVTKLQTYDAITGNPAWLQKVLMLVGDADNGGDNSYYKVLNDQLRTDKFSAWNPSLLTTRYSSSYYPSGWPANATLETKAQWNAGYGYVNALGNTTDLDNLVFMANFNLPGFPGASGDTFTTALNGTNYLPLVFGATSFPTWFAGDFDRTLAEDLLLSASNRGAIAVIAPSHKENLLEAYYMNGLFADLLFKQGVRNVGRLFSGTKALYRTQDGAQDFSDQLTLIGDPATNLKLSPLPTPVSFVGGGEIEDPAWLQATESQAGTSGISNATVRVVHTENDVSPLSSERMLRAQLTDASGSASSIEWKIQQNMNLTIRRNTILSFWMYLYQSPSGNGKFILDGMTSQGRIGARTDIFDQYGVGLDAKLRTSPGTGWKFYYADLSPLENATLQDLRLRYESTSPSDSGSLLAYIENVRVEQVITGTNQYQEIMNYDFESDVDRNGTPDFWTNLAGQTQAAQVQSDATTRLNGLYSMRVQDSYCGDEGAMQIFHANQGIATYSVSFYHKAPYASTFSIRILDAATSAILYEMVGLPTGPTWDLASATFTSPSLGGAVSLVKFEIIPEYCSPTPMYVDDLVMYAPITVGVDDRESVDRGGPHIDGISPNPARPGESVTVRFSLPSTANASLRLFDVTGRVRNAVPPQNYSSGSHQAIWTIDSGRNFPPEIYFIGLFVDGRLAEQARRVTVLR